MRIDLASLCERCLKKRGIEVPKTDVVDIEQCHSSGSRCGKRGARVKMLDSRWFLFKEPVPTKPVTH
jgi:hypothetical protein